LSKKYLSNIFSNQVGPFPSGFFVFFRTLVFFMPSRIFSFSCWIVIRIQDLIRLLSHAQPAGGLADLIYFSKIFEIILLFSVFSFIYDY